LKEQYRKEWPQLQRELDDAVEQVDRRGFCIAVGGSRPNRPRHPLDDIECRETTR
jgi:hypothetical protein